jgi:hypothetical protein
MMYRPLTENLGEELLMSFRAGFHAKTSAQQEKALESTENGQECGEKWHASFAKYDPDSRLWRTPQCSLLGDLEPYSETWPQWGLMRGGECWEQLTLEQTIRGTEYGLSQQMLPTPTVTDSTNEKRIGGATVYLDKFGKPRRKMVDGQSASMGLARLVQYWPTPTTRGYGHGAEGMASNLIDKVQQGILTKQQAESMLNLKQLENHRTWKKKFPTPTAHNSKETASPSEYKRNTPTLGTHAGGKLNPMWVEWLMGWTLGWTDLKPLETDKYHSVPQPLGKS